MSQPTHTFPPEVAAIDVPITSESMPVTAMRLPIAILLISVGSGNFFDQMRQNMTAMKRKLTETMESSVINQVVGIFFPKKMRLAWSCAQTRYALKICWFGMIAIVRNGKSIIRTMIAILSRRVSLLLAV